MLKLILKIGVEDFHWSWRRRRRKGGCIDKAASAITFFKLKLMVELNIC